MVSLEILEYRGFKEKFFGFCKAEEKDPDEPQIINYYLLYGKTAGITVNCSQESTNNYYQNISFSVLTSKTLEIEIPFLVNEKNRVISLIPVKDKQDYDRLVQIMEDLL